MDIAHKLARIYGCAAPNNFTFYPSAVRQRLLGAGQFSTFVALSVNHGPGTVASTLKGDNKVWKNHGAHLNPIVNQLCLIF